MSSLSRSGDLELSALEVAVTVNPVDFVETDARPLQVDSYLVRCRTYKDPDTDRRVLTL